MSLSAVNMETTTTSHSRVALLTGAANWQVWKRAVRMMLLRQDLWDIVDPDNPESDKASTEAKRRSQMALSDIFATLDVSIQDLIDTATTGREAFRILKDRFEIRDEATQMRKQAEFTGMRQSGGEPMVAWTQRVKTMAAECRMIGVEITDKNVITVILHGLDPRYQQLRNMLQMSAQMSNIPLTLDGVTSSLISAVNSNELSDGEPIGAFYAHGNGKSRQHDHGALWGKKSDRKPGNCHWCGKKGHWEAECFAKKNGKPRTARKDQSNGRMPKQEKSETIDYSERANDQMRAYRGNASSTSAWVSTVVGTAARAAIPGEDEFILDSGATDHIFCNRSVFKSIKPTPGNHVALGGEGISIPVEGRGAANIVAISGDHRHEMQISEAYFVPRAAANLISIARLMEKGAEVSFVGKKAMITRGGQLICEAYRRDSDRQYAIRIDRASPVTVAKASVAKVEKAPIELWHERLGHPSHDAIRRLASVVDGIEITEEKRSTEPVCQGCQMGKGKRDPFPTRESHTTRPFELVHVDLAGPMRVPTPDGARWFTVFVDDFTHMHWVTLTAYKTDVLGELRQLTALVERQTPHRLGRIRSDGEAVLASREAKEWFRETGVRHEKTVPYTPQQNGVAERAIRSMAEGAKALIFGAKNLIHGREVDQQLWGEAVRTMAYLLNRTPRAKNPDTTPFEIFTGDRPTLSHLRVFGSTAYVHIPKERRSGKFGPHRQLAIFVGYPEGVKGWRFWDPETKKFIIAREAAFLEVERIESVVIDHQQPDAGGRVEEIDEEPERVDQGQQSVGVDQSQKPVGVDQEPEPAEDNQESVGATDPTPDPKPGEGPVETPRTGARELPNRSRRFAGSYRDLAGKRTNKPAAKFAAIAYSANAHITLSVPASYRAAMRSEQADKWQDACQKEMTSLAEKGVWELVQLPSDRKTIGSKWVFDIKRDENGDISRYKARLVARGFAQTHGVDYFDTFASVAKFASIRTALSIAASRDLEIIQIDIETAYLNGILEEEVFMEQPEGFVVPGGLVCRLKKALYGLKQAGRTWLLRLREELSNIGFRPLNADDCIYTNGREFILVYVDDMLVLASDEGTGWGIVEMIEQAFGVKRIGTPKKFLGMEIDRDREERVIMLRQMLYVNTILERFGMADCAPVHTPMSTGWTGMGDDESIDPLYYQSVVGSAMYLMQATRPDLAYAVGALSRYYSAPRVMHLEAAKRVMRYLKGTIGMGLTLGGSKPTLVGYSDSAHGDDIATGRSTGGFVFTFGCGAVSWSSKRQPLVTLSTTESEYVGATLAAKEAIWLRSLASEFGMQMGPTLLYGDNQSAIAIASKPDFRARTKHINQRYHFIRECVDNGEIDYRYVPTDDMTADSMTKALPREKHHRFAVSMGISNVGGSVESARIEIGCGSTP